MIIALGGLSKTGKTTLARALAEALPGILLEKATLWQALFPEQSTASPERSAWSDEVLLKAAVWNLEATPGSVVVLDGHPLARHCDVLALRRFASGIRQPLHIIECVCPAEVAVRRGRFRPSGLQVPECHVGLPEQIPQPKITVNTLLSPDRCLSMALEAIRKAAGIHPESKAGAVYGR